MVKNQLFKKKLFSDQEIAKELRIEYNKLFDLWRFIKDNEISFPAEQVLNNTLNTLNSDIEYYLES